MVRVALDGWDSRALIVARRWVLRVARNEEVARAFAVEARLLPELDSLPLETPRRIAGGRRWLLTSYVEGDPYAGRADLRPLGEFLRALHAFPIERARALGAQLHDPRDDAELFRRRVLPLLDGDERSLAASLLDEHASATFDPRLTHADLGPAHVLVRRGRVSGLIDWTDARLGDPAIDLAWALSAAPEVAETYPVDDELRRRALVYHALGPWHEVEHGLRRGERRWVESGLAGVRARLPGATGGPDTMAG